MPIISRSGVSLAPGATVTWEVTFNPNNTFLPVAVPLAKPEPLTPGFAGVFLGVSNVRTSIKASGADAAYVILFDISNLAQIGNPIFHQVVVGFAQ